VSSVEVVGAGEGGEVLSQRVAADHARQSTALSDRSTDDKHGQRAQMSMQPGRFDNSCSCAGTRKIGKP
jgi:hypothetical protein